MEQVKESAICLCVGCIVCSAITILTPKGGMEKIIKLAVGAFLLLTVINGALKLKPKPSNISFIENTTITENHEALNDFAQNVIKRQLKGHIEAVLNQISVVSEKIEIETDISDDNSISIGQITVAVDEKAYLKKEQIENEIYIKTGMKATVCVQKK